MLLLSPCKLGMLAAECCNGGMKIHWIKKKKKHCILRPNPKVYFFSGVITSRNIFSSKDENKIIKIPNLNLKIKTKL